jgi:hypothetical protein
MVLTTRKIFVTTLMFLTLVALGCASNRRTVISVHAEATAYETSPLYQAAGTARISYRLESGPSSGIN